MSKNSLYAFCYIVIKSLGELSPGPKAPASSCCASSCCPSRVSGSLGSEPHEHSCAFVSESDFFVSAILGAFPCYCAEGFNECGVLGAVHYVGDAVLGDVNKLGCLVGVEVGVEVGALAYCGACRFDGVMEEVGALIVCDVVGFFYLSREGEAEALFEVLSVVVVCAVDVGVDGDGCHFGEFLSRSFHIYYTIFSGVCQ